VRKIAGGGASAGALFTQIPNDIIQPGIADFRSEDTASLKSDEIKEGRL
jgi:hypothetical protein